MSERCFESVHVRLPRIRWEGHVRGLGERIDQLGDGGKGTSEGPSVAGGGTVDVDEAGGFLTMPTLAACTSCQFLHDEAAELMALG